MSEELIQRNLVAAPETMGAWNYYNIGATSLKALKVAKIIPNKDYEEYENKKPDALIVKKPQIIAAVEYKQPKELRTQKQIRAAIAQEIGTARVLGAKLYIVTDSKKTFWINPLTGNEIITEDGSHVALNFNKDDSECVKLINKIIVSISATNDIILESAVVDPLPLAQKVWQDLWSVSGATPENCLYTFVEIFIFKYLSDLGVLSGFFSFGDLLNRYKTNSDNQVIEYYANTVRPEIKRLFKENPKDKTTIINGTIFVSKDDKAVSGYATVFKKILVRFEEFGTLENIDYDFKSKLFETFLKESISKKNWGQFFTPLKVVRAIVGMADISAGMKICDPACGVGKFLLELVLHDIHRWFTIENGELSQQIILHGFDKGFDKDEQKTIILAKANMLIYMSSMIREYPGLTEQFSDLFNSTFLLQTNSILGTLANPVNDEYDLILTNPPYVMSGSSNLKDEISKKTPDEVVQKKKSLLEQHYTISAMGVEGLFMEWIIRALKPGGKTFVIVPDGIMNRSNDKRLRDFILDECNIDAVISLPLNTFFTTNKRTYIMALTKKIPHISGGVMAKERQSTPVFIYLCSEIGETRDVYRFDIEQNDLDIASASYNMFKGARERYRSNDKRCKIINIENFYNGMHWSVERWWTQEERIELGIEDEDESVTLEELGSIVGDIANTLLEYQDLLVGLQKKNYNLTYKTISITDDSVFNILSAFYLGKNNAELAKLPLGKIPVYSAAKEPIAFIQEQSIPPIYASVEKPFLSFANDGDGSAGRNFILHTEPFYVRAKRYAFQPKREDISLPYVWCQIADIKKRFGFSRTFIANRNNLKAVTVDFPLDENGNFNFEEQQTIAEQFSILGEMRDELRQKFNEVAGLTIATELVKDYNFRLVKVSEMFAIVRGSGKYTKTYAQGHQGDYPLYSGNTSQEFALIDSYDFDVPCLSWAIDGLAGYMMVHRNAFSATNHRGVLLPKRSDLDINYAKFALEPIFRRVKKGRVGENGENEYTSLPPFMIENIEFEIPVDTEGNFDTAVQYAIASKYLTIEQYKREILDKLSALITKKVEL